MRLENYYKVCWITDTISQIYTQSTANLSGTSYIKHPLHFVSNQTQRLKHRYSVLFRQYLINENAFRYWNDLKNNSNTGGLIDKQPSLAVSNICNCEDPEEHVLGFFSISGVTEKRIFLDQIEGLEIPNNIFCFPGSEFPRLWFFPSNELPLFLAQANLPDDEKEYFGLVRKSCVDCREYRGSKSEPPDFW